MSDDIGSVRVYYFPQIFPCGPQSSCCGPTGTSAEELAGYVRELESALSGVRVETIDASQKVNPDWESGVVRLLNTFGAAACPIFSVNGEVVSIGPPVLGELVPTLAEKLRVTA